MFSITRSRRLSRSFRFSRYLCSLKRDVWDLMSTSTCLKARRTEMNVPRKTKLTSIVRQAPFSVCSPPVSLQRFSTEKLLPYERLLLQLASQQSMYVTFYRLTPSGRLSQLKTLQRHYAVRRASSVNLILPQRGWSSNALTSCLQSSLL